MRRSVASRVCSCDEAAGAALEPAGHIDAGQWGVAGKFDDSATAIRYNARRIIERNRGRRCGTITDGAQHQAGRQHLDLVGRFGPDLPIGAGDQSIASQPQALHVFGPSEFDGTLESKHQALGTASRLPIRQLTQ
jgi:hypothetical protein